MGTYFFDTSAIVKRYVAEPGSGWVNGLVDEEGADSQRVHAIFVSRISQVEVAAALGILLRVGRIIRRWRDVAYDSFNHELVNLYHILELTPIVIQRAADLTDQHPLKAYDAVQLATALEFSQVLAPSEISLTFVSGDTTLLKAAQPEGLMIDNPFDHP